MNPQIAKQIVEVFEKLKKNQMAVESIINSESSGDYAYTYKYELELLRDCIRNGLALVKVINTNGYTILEDYKTHKEGVKFV